MDARVHPCAGQRLGLPCWIARSSLSHLDRGGGSWPGSRPEPVAQTSPGDWPNEARNGGRHRRWPDTYFGGWQLNQY